MREQCLEWALETGQSIGVWGSTSETERRALKRRTAARRGSGWAGGEHRPPARPDFTGRGRG
ncbi:hypothetical protein GCM10009601_33860 [Streptomyces thermospinosisporus]|uniref:4Fe-4S Wbl-type domain-containing protein n=1 Tax=Streptomyces thermospinosisporus TaxID=161482 RepID=A0ABN1YZG0_9ACTN